MKPEGEIIEDVLALRTIEKPSQVRKGTYMSELHRQARQSETDEEPATQDSTAKKPQTPVKRNLFEPTKYMKKRTAKLLAKHAQKSVLALKSLNRADSIDRHKDQSKSGCLDDH